MTGTVSGYLLEFVKRGLLFAALAIGVGGVAAAAPGPVDCPLRDAPFSADSPLVDLLLSPAARAVLEGVAPGKLAHVPERFAGTQPPTFAAILTLRQAGIFLSLSPDELAAADARLRALPVTDADRRARCTRYDDDLPRLAIPAGHPRVLLFEKINGFRDSPSVDAAHVAFVAMAARDHWALVTTKNGGAIKPATLRRFDVVVWNNVSGDVLTLAERTALRRWVEGGGGFVAFHGSGGDPVYFWDWYVDTLIGARFAGHPIAPQFQTARVVTEDPASPIMRGVPGEWSLNEEWYSFSTNPRASGAHVLATLDERSYDPVGMAGQQLRMGDHPLAWTRCIGRGRSFYSAIGHRPEGYANPIYVRMLEQAVIWAASRSNPCGSPASPPPMETGKR